MSNYNTTGVTAIYLNRKTEADFLFSSSNKDVDAD